MPGTPVQLVLSCMVCCAMSYLAQESALFGMVEATIDHTLTPSGVQQHGGEEAGAQHHNIQQPDCSRR